MSPNYSVRREYETSHKWEWHQEGYRIQKRYDNNREKTIVRKVYIDEKYMIYAEKDDNYNIISYIYFITECEPNSNIITGEKFSKGEDKVLICGENGDAIFFGAKAKPNENNLVWKEDFKGFSFREDLGVWDFELLDREITLTKAKKNSDMEKDD